MWGMLLAYDLTRDREILASVERQMDQWIDMMRKLAHLAEADFIADLIPPIMNRSRRGALERMDRNMGVAHENLGTAKQATGIASELIELQNGPCDVACICDARCGVGNYAPLFNPLAYKPHKAYPGGRCPCPYEIRPCPDRDGLLLPDEVACVCRAAYAIIIPYRNNSLSV